MRYQAKDLTGQTFERLKVIGRTERPQYHADKDAWWECECQCGAVVKVNASALKRGRTKSCGCLNREKASERMKRLHALASERDNVYGG